MVRTEIRPSHWSNAFSWCQIIIWPKIIKGQPALTHVIRNLHFATRSAATLPLMSHTQIEESARAQNPSRATTTLAYHPPNHHPHPHPLVVRRGNPDQLRLLQLPQPGTQQHRPHPHRRGRSDVHKLPTPGRPDGLTSQPNGHTTWWQRRHYGPHNDVVFTSCVCWAETPTQQHSWRSSHPPWWRTADQTTDARKNKEKGGSSLYAWQPHLASTYGSKSFSSPPHSISLKIKGQGHEWGHSSNSQFGSNILSTHIPFVPCQSSLPFLRYSIFKIWPWKSRVKVTWPWCCTTTGLDNSMELWMV